MADTCVAGRVYSANVGAGGQIFSIRKIRCMFELVTGLGQIVRVHLLKSIVSRRTTHRIHIHTPQFVGDMSRFSKETRLLPSFCTYIAPRFCEHQTVVHYNNICLCPLTHPPCPTHWVFFLLVVRIISYSFKRSRCYSTPSTGLPVSIK